jgi:hypothetical protein
MAEIQFVESSPNLDLTCHTRLKPVVSKSRASYRLFSMVEDQSEGSEGINLLQGCLWKVLTAWYGE